MHIMFHTVRLVLAAQKTVMNHFTSTFHPVRGGPTMEPGFYYFSYLGGREGAKGIEEGRKSNVGFCIQIKRSENQGETLFQKTLELKF